MRGSEGPYRGHLTKFLQIIHQSGCENLILSYACLQSLNGCRLNTIALVVELTYLHVVVKGESFLGGATVRHVALCTNHCLLFSMETHFKSS